MLRPHLSRMMLRASCAILAVAMLGCARDRDADRRETATGDVAAETSVRVSNVELGRAIGSDNHITDRTDDFRPNDTIYASVVTEGSGPNTTLTARWVYEDDQVVDESTRTISATGRDVTEFHISRPSGWPTGSYKLHVLVNGREVETKDFRVS